MKDSVVVLLLLSFFFLCFAFLLVFYKQEIKDELSVRNLSKDSIINVGPQPCRRGR